MQENQSRVTRDEMRHAATGGKEGRPLGAKTVGEFAKRSPTRDQAGPALTTWRRRDFDHSDDPRKKRLSARFFSH